MAVLLSAKPYDGFLRISFQNEEKQQQTSDYHYFWLRHNCDCKSGCRHPATNERVIDSSEIPLSLSPVDVKIVDEATLQISWPLLPSEALVKKVHVSEYKLPFLLKNAYAINRTYIAPPESDVKLVEIDFEELRNKYPPQAGEDPSALSGEGMAVYRKLCYDRMKNYGCLVLRKRGLDTESIIRDFLPSGKEVISTHFGRIEDLKTDNTTNSNTDQLGYTDAPVDLHTDQPFIENPPGMQLLQCVNPAEIGGDNYIVDARQAALYLKSTDYPAYKLLITNPVRFHRKQQNFESIQERCIIEVDENGTIQKCRFSYFTYAPHIVSFEQMQNWYEAYNKFTTVVRDPKNQYKFLLNSGDAVLYDNHRMFHARKGFKGKRHMRGVYFDSNDVFERLAK